MLSHHHHLKKGDNLSKNAVQYFTQEIKGECSTITLEMKQQFNE